MQIQKREKGQKRYGGILKMAWAFEIMAAFTGLAIAFTSIDVLRDGITTEDVFVVLPIGLALALVAFAELPELCRYPARSGVHGCPEQALESVLRGSYPAYGSYHFRDHA